MGIVYSNEPICSQGYQVLHVEKNSPAEHACLVPYFDFIISIDSILLDKNHKKLIEILKSKNEQTINVTVYNSRLNTFREIMITPCTNWGGFGYLGVKIGFCSFEKAAERIWRILNVKCDSPASKAGLQSNVDFIFGSETLNEYETDLYNLIEANIDKPITLYVYNSRTDQSRAVVVTPSLDWGGEGLLGCDLAHGYLHRIPILFPLINPNEAMTKEINHNETTNGSTFTFLDGPLMSQPIEYSTNDEFARGGIQHV